MPEISRFFGIVIAMFFDDHNPPHFHARYGSYSIAIRIEDFAILEGYLPPKALGLVIEWADIHNRTPKVRRSQCIMMFKKHGILKDISLSLSLKTARKELLI